MLSSLFKIVDIFSNILRCWRSDSALKFGSTWPLIRLMHWQRQFLRPDREEWKIHKNIDKSKVSVQRQQRQSGMTPLSKIPLKQDLYSAVPMATVKVSEP